MRPALAAALALGALAVPAIAQEMPKPGPEQARLAYYEGTWKYEGESKPSPMGPGGKISMTESCQWFEGGFHMVCRSEGTTPAGPAKGQGIMAYDAAEKTYTYYGISSLGDGFFVRGNVAGNVWTWQTETTMDGNPVKFRGTSTETSPTSYTFKLEISVGGGAWAVMEEGTSTKQ